MINEKKRSFLYVFDDIICKLCICRYFRNYLRYDYFVIRVYGFLICWFFNFRKNKVFDLMFVGVYDLNKELGFRIIYLKEIIYRIGIVIIV